jgi:hypothetical protein
MKCLNLQNGLEVDKILNVFYFQINGALKIPMYYKIMHVIIIMHKTYSVKVGLNTKLTQSCSNYF